MVRSGDSTSLPGRFLQGGNSLYQGTEFFSGGSFHMVPSLGFSVFSRVVQLPISGPVSSLFSLNTAYIIVSHPFFNSACYSIGTHQLPFVLFLLLLLFLDALEEQSLNHWTTRRVPECISYFFARTQDGTVVVLQCHLQSLYVSPLFPVLKIRGQYSCSNSSISL